MMQRGRWLILVAALLLCGMSNCHGEDAEGEAAETDLGWGPFRELARSADCADEANRLFVIDEELVFWDRRGACPDNPYRQALYGSSVDEVLCERSITIAGPRQGCSDATRTELFSRIIEGIEQPNLGLAPEHEVQQIPF